MKILVFDSDTSRREEIRRTIRSLGYEEPAIKPEEDPINILCFLEDSSLPDIVFCSGEEGLSLCRKWKMEEKELRHSEVHMIFVGGKDTNFREAVLHGADDFLVWPGGESSIESRIMLSELRRKEREESSLDHLTKVLNRKALELNLRNELERARRKDERVGLIFLDVDDFKNINDSYGHDVGDAVLGELAERIRNSIRQYDYVGRFGGDEFLVILVDCEREEALKRVADLQSNISSKPILAELSINLSVSIGLVISDRSERNAKRLLKRVDSMLYRAKSEGKNRIEIF